MGKALLMLSKEAGIKDFVENAAKRVRVTSKLALRKGRQMGKKLNPMNHVRESVKKTMGSASDDAVHNMNKIRAAGEENLAKVTKAGTQAAGKMGTSATMQAIKIGAGTGTGLALAGGLPYATYRGLKGKDNDKKGKENG